MPSIQRQIGAQYLVPPCLKLGRVTERMHEREVNNTINNTESAYPNSTSGVNEQPGIDVLGRYLSGASLIG